MRFIMAVATVVAVCQVDSQTYILPDGSDTLINNLKTTFSCDNRPYGYYADVDNDCKVFHVCQPIDGEDGQVNFSIDVQKNLEIYTFQLYFF